MKTLWEIYSELQKAIQELIENGGELTDELNEVLTVNNNEFEEKALNYIWLIKNLENVANFIKDIGSISFKKVIDFFMKK